MMTKEAATRRHRPRTPAGVATSDPRVELLLAESGCHHAEGICPRQILGVRMGLFAAELLGLTVPREDKRLLAFVETDGCFVDGLSAATGCRIGSRTLRFEDHGKIAATFVDTDTGACLRLVPQRQSRSRAVDYAPDALTRRSAQLIAYRQMPDNELFIVNRVTLRTRLGDLLSTPSALAYCDACGEEIINGRETHVGGSCLCRACRGDGYYQ